MAQMGNGKEEKGRKGRKEGKGGRRRAISDSLDGKVCLSRCSKGLVATLILDIFRLVVSRDCQCFGRWSEKVRGLVLG